MPGCCLGSLVVDPQWRSKEETWAGDVPYCTNAFISCTRSSLGHFRIILNASMMECNLFSLKPAQNRHCRSKRERILGHARKPSKGPRVAEICP